MQAAFLSILDYVDVFCIIHAASSMLHLLDSMHHSALQFITNSGTCTHHCTPNDLVEWPSLSLQRQQLLYVFVYKAMLGKLPAY